MAFSGEEILEEFVESSMLAGDRFARESYVLFLRSKHRNDMANERLRVRYKFDPIFKQKRLERGAKYRRDNKDKTSAYTKSRWLTDPGFRARKAAKQREYYASERGKEEREKYNAMRNARKASRRAGDRG